MLKIAIIGAGLAGVTLARQLSDKADVTLFEKSRGIGGRMATRYAGIFEFDHGAQYFSARTDAFRGAIDPLIRRGVVAEWHGPIVTLGSDSTAADTERSDPVYVAAPRMNSLPKTLADGLEVTVRCEIASLNVQPDDRWILSDTDGNAHGPFDWVVSTAPSVQTSALLPPETSFKDKVADATMTGCFSILLGFDERPPVEWAGAKVENSPIGWIAVNSDKPGRETSPSLVVQTTNVWAEEHMERNPDTVAETILEALSALTPIDVSKAKHMSIHRWRYAHTPGPVGDDFLIDEILRIAACGDWCLGGRVECAFTSAYALSKVLPV